MLNLILLALASWRLSYLLVNEPGPFQVFATLRYYAGASWVECTEQQQNAIKNPFCCVYCMSLYTSAFLLIVQGVWSDGGALLTLWLAVAAGVIFIQEIVHWFKG